MKFTVSLVTYLFILFLTVVAWIGFEAYHQSASKEIPRDLITLTKDPLPTSFDSETLKKLYEGKEKFYEVEGQATQN